MNFLVSNERYAAKTTNDRIIWRVEVGLRSEWRRPFKIRPQFLHNDWEKKSNAGEDAEIVWIVDTSTTEYYATSASILCLISPSEYKSARSWSRIVDQNWCLLRCWFRSVWVSIWRRNEPVSISIKQAFALSLVVKINFLFSVIWIWTKTGEVAKEEREHSFQSWWDVKQRRRRLRIFFFLGSAGCMKTNIVAFDGNWEGSHSLTKREAIYSVDIYSWKWRKFVLAKINFFMDVNHDREMRNLMNECRPMVELSSNTCPVPTRGEEKAMKRRASYRIKFFTFLSDVTNIQRRRYHHQCIKREKLISEGKIDWSVFLMKFYQHVSSTYVRQRRWVRDDWMVNDREPSFIFVKSSLA